MNEFAAIVCSVSHLFAVVWCWMGRLQVVCKLRGSHEKLLPAARLWLGQIQVAFAGRKKGLLGGQFRGSSSIGLILGRVGLFVDQLQRIEGRECAFCSGNPIGLHIVQVGSAHGFAHGNVSSEKFSSHSIFYDALHPPSSLDTTPCTTVSLIPDFTPTRMYHWQRPSSHIFAHSPLSFLPPHTLPSLLLYYLRSLAPDTLIFAATKTPYADILRRNPFSLPSILLPTDRLYPSRVESSDPVTYFIEKSRVGEVEFHLDLDFDRHIMEEKS
ncbi:hypothetical protein L6452_22257 [Arctium lappa]|uniref:Uncharacterized protein n=1 Tax=Arctium lappa TaxID=4217 RepID=A0ACB9AYF8_ARCLA|nr:hypothetical protein L6452_22257 [Arctium lappa]